ncbi:MAG: hypothetical protein KatS3mg012_0572 [Gaiellaceae bacterium]|nr:MAG: hypothetical protein KatS3mg012_0572 [Gaiellaceae bacterium]
MTASVSSLVSEAGSVVRAVREAQESGVGGAVLVSGVLADHLARELGAGADPGVVRVGDVPGADAAVAVRIIAGDPSDEDRAFVVRAERVSVPVVLVQLWPQADWTRPFVLSPFVVECRAGEGFPLSEIASRIAEATEGSLRLAARVPTLRDAATTHATRTAVARAALLGLRGRSRSPLTLEQVRLAIRLRSLEARAVDGAAPELAATTAAVVAGGLVLRVVARRLRRVLPEPLANAVVAAGGTWALAETLRRAEARGRR